VRLSHRAFLLISIPLICELGFVCVFYCMLQNVEDETRREVHARHILDCSNSLLNAYYQSGMTLGAFLLTRSPDQLQKYEAISARMEKYLGTLESLWHDDNPEIAASVADVSLKAKTVVEASTMAARKIAQGNIIAGVFTLSRTRNDMDELSEKLWSVTNRAHDVLQKSMKVQSEERQKLGVVLWAGIVLNIVVVIGLAIAFNRTTVKRLAVLIDNTSRVAAGRELNPQLGGSDEIAELDRTFHETAVAIDLLRTKERELLSEMMIIMESMPVGLVILDERGAVLEVNARLRQMMQLEQGSAIGDMFINNIIRMSNGTLTYAESPAHPAVLMLENLLGTDSLSDAEVVRVDGSVIPVALSISSMKLESEGHAHLLVLIDVSDRKELEKLKRDFMTMVTHDLRTPLASSQIFLEMLESNSYRSLGPETRNSAKEVSRSASRLMILINDLLDIERLESGKLSLAKRPVSIEELFRATTDLVSTVAAQRDVTVDWDVPEELNVLADEERLLQAFANIVFDAVAEAPPTSTIDLFATAKDVEHVELRVSNRDRALSESEVELMFDRFKCVSQRTAGDAPTANGVRLAISKVIMEQHGGDVWVSCTPSDGTVFNLTLPKFVRQTGA
jgi:PAS domain S-box-containing protein